MKNEEIEKIKMILDVINIKLSINSYSPIIYIPFVDFPDQLKRFEINEFLYKLSDDLKILKFTQITDGQKLAEQQVCIVVEDRSKFYEFKKIINGKYQDIISGKNSNKETTKNSNLFFDEKNKQLCNSNGKKSQEIKGGPLRLLKCFLKNKETLKCKKVEILKTMGGQDQYGGARRQLLSLISGVADIDSIRSKNNKKTVEYYQLKGL